jgi:ribosomal-protein-alanine N-acetyltransferase
MAGEDLDEVMKIEEVSFSSPWSRGMFLSELKDNPFSNLLTAKLIDSHQIIGYSCFWIVFGEVHIMNLAVHPDWRRKGIATRLVEKAISTSHQHAVKKLHLEVRRSNEPARRLYEKFGFQVVAVRSNYYAQPREDALLMAMDLV